MSSNQPTNNQPSPRVALKAITPGHLMVSVIVTAIVTAGDAGIQYAQSNAGHFSVTQLIGAALFSLFGTLGTGVVSLESTPTVQQAIDGALAQHTSALTTLVQQHAAVVNQLVSVVHTLSGQAIQAVPPPPVVSPPVQQSQPTAQQIQSTPWTNTVAAQGQPVVQQVPFPPQFQYTAPTAAISSTQAQQPGQPQ